MPPKTPKKLLSNMLESLSQSDFKKFVHELVDREGEQQVRRNRVEGKSYLEVADAMISTFTDKKALRVAVEILEEIDCSQDATKLAELAGLSSNGGEQSGPSASAVRSAGGADDEHFVDKHRLELTQRVTNVLPILDKLLMHKVLRPEVYDQISAMGTNQAKMRGIYDGPMKSGRACKDIFHKILKDEEPFLLSDLEGN